MWLHGSIRTRSPSANSDRQIAHSSCEANQPGWSGSGVVDATSSEDEDDATAGNSGSATEAIMAMGRELSSASTAGTTITTSPSLMCTATSPGSGTTASSIFAHVLLLLQMRQGKPRTISSGARSRFSARACAMRCTKSVESVKMEGMRSKERSVTSGL